MATKRTPAEIQKALEIQRAAITDSCAAFDNGKKWEALRLATSVYILVHDGGKRNKSLLTQLGVRDQMKFLCSGHQIDDRNLTSSNPLAMMHMRASEDPMFVPILDEHSERYRWSSFGEWWTRDAIFSSGSGKNLVYRKNLVFNLRNKDGGAHYDETLGDIEYQEMVRGGGWMIIKGNLPERAMVDLELVSMRQIAHEVLASIKRAGLA